MFRFVLGPLLQGQMRVAKLKSVYNLLIIEKSGHRCVLGLVKYWAKIMLILLKGQVTVDGSYFKEKN